MSFAMFALFLIMFLTFLMTVYVIGYRAGYRRGYGIRKARLKILDGGKHRWR